jgi:hypothetical protein
MKRLKKRIAAKLKGNAGESLAEVLISLLIAALALTMLASVISTSARIITKSKAMMKDYYDASDELVEGAGTKISSTGSDIKPTYVSVKIGDDSVILRSAGSEDHPDYIKVSGVKINDTYSGGVEVAAYQLP